MPKLRNVITVCVLASLCIGCTVHPRGEATERQTAIEAGKPYEHPIEERQLPPLAPDAGPDELVTYALLSNAELEQHYWEWRSTIEQIPQEGTQKTNVMVSFTSMITNGSTAADMNTLGIGNDPMNNIVLPSKLGTSARIALENARAAGIRFDKARFDLRHKVLDAYDDYALAAELIRLQQEEVQYLQAISKVTESRLATGGSMQQDLIHNATDSMLAENELAAQRAKLPGLVATINALLNRPPDASLTLPTSLPIPRPITETDDQILAMAIQNNPELAAQTKDIEAKKIAIRRARQDYLPDFGVNASTDLAGVTQSTVGSLSLPILRYEAIKAEVRQAKANLLAAEAMRRQAGFDLAAQVIADLAAFREADRQETFLEKSILPELQQIAAFRRNAYVTGQATLLDTLDLQRSLIEIRRLISEVKIEREKRLADIERMTQRDLLSSIPTTSP